MNFRWLSLFRSRKEPWMDGDWRREAPFVSIYKKFSQNSKIGWDRGFWVPRAFKLDHLQSLEHIWFWKFLNFSAYILGGQFLLPQRSNKWKREFNQLQNWMRQRVLGTMGIQTGSFAAPWAHLVLEIFILFSLHTGRPILITPEVQ